jgi:hypothetical protein
MNCRVKAASEEIEKLDRLKQVGRSFSRHRGIRLILLLAPGACDSTDSSESCPYLDKLWSHVLGTLLPLRAPK